jgi:Tol biopolymer transport system component
MSWSPDSREIALAAGDGAGNVDIYRVSRDGAAPLRVTVSPGMDMAPTWSPDGRSIGYTRVAGGETHVWVIPATGGNPRRISEGGDVTQMVVWADDSQTIAYQVMTEESRHQIWTTRLDSEEPATLVAQSDVLVWPVAWSADGEEVLLWRVRDQTSVLCAARKDGSGEQDLGEIEKGNLFSFAVALNPAGERYRDRIYKSGQYVFTDGESKAEVCAVRVVGLLESPLEARVIGE